MRNVQEDINRLIDSFSSAILSLARRQVIAELADSVRDGVQAFDARTLTAAFPSERPRGAKRAPEDLGALQQQFVDFVTANPGLRIEQINKQLGTSTKDLALPIRKALAAKAISVKGQKRATTYYPAGSAKAATVKKVAKPKVTKPKVTKPKAATKPVAAKVVKAAAKPKAVAKPKPKPAATPVKAAKPVTKPVAKAIKPAAKPAKPAAKATKPVTKPVTKPTAKAAKPAAKPAKPAALTVVPAAVPVPPSIRVEDGASAAANA